MMKKAVRVIIHGYVQGVFFRIFIKENADKMNIKGFVRNLPNGDVEALFEGDHIDVDNMLKFVKEGPRHANIKRIEVQEKNYSGEYKDFKVLNF
jgi:acylphosphatase